MRIFLASMATTLALIFSAALPAQAGVITWAFNYSSPVDGISASGLITTTDTLAGGSYAILSISGTRTAASSPNIANIIGPSPYAAATNNLFPAFPWVDFGGLSYLTDAGVAFNVYYQPGHYELRSDSNPGGFPDGLYPITLNISQVPEPAVLAIIAVAFASLLFFAGIRRRA